MAEITVDGETIGRIDAVILAEVVPKLELRAGIGDYNAEKFRPDFTTVPARSANKIVLTVRRL